MSQSAPPASATEALGMLESALGYLSAADATALAAETQARCLHALERATAVGTAARTWILAAFTAGQGYCADADYSPRAWLVNRTRVTKGAAAGYTAWVRRAAAHPQVAAVLAAGQMSESYARTICGWTGKLPEECRADADAILLSAAGAGMDLRDLAALAAEIYARSLPDAPDDGDDGAFEDRCVRLETTFEGAGVMGGDLTPECAAVVGAVLDALSAPAGAEDTRTHAQRYHDGLQEAMRRLVAGGLLPERAGQPVKAWVHISLADLLAMDGSSALLEEWTAGVRAAWAGHRAAGSAGGGSDGGAWLDGDAAAAMTCDAAMAPVVTGDVNPAALEDLIRLCVQLHRLRGDGDAGPGGTGTGTDRTGDSGGGGGPGAGGPDTARGWEALEQAVIGKAVDLLSGPGRAGSVPAPPAARRPAGRAEPAAGHRVQPDHPGRHPQRGDPAGPALPVGRAVPPARRGVRGAPRPAQEERRPDQHERLRAAVLLPPPGGHSPVGLDAGAEPGRHHHRVEQRQDQGPAQPQPTGQGRVTPGVSGPQGFTSKLRLVRTGQSKR